MCVRIEINIHDPPRGIRHVHVSAAQIELCSSGNAARTNCADRCDAAVGRLQRGVAFSVALLSRVVKVMGEAT